VGNDYGLLRRSCGRFCYSFQHVLLPLASSEIPIQWVSL
jgi:hypothetical protein